ncbi:sugar phosphate isomerase/epimerase family protein [Mucilaginibacter antarcticus]|uniref:sugar phosphate isomerase/epimerase family protein n=1 Tax=Mucilaginibacter antarcticus TaxID=1855725 RepID=UPI003631D8F7
MGSEKTENLEAYIEAANATGQSHVIIPSINHDFIKTVDDCKAVADKMNKAGEILKKSGLKLGYHNHNFEWQPVGDTTFYDTILKNTDPKLVDMELDLYWVVRSKQDAVGLFAKNPGRFKFVHVKDMDKAKPGLNTEIGAGSVDF